MQKVKISGTDTKSVKVAKEETSALYPYLSWLDPYVVPRQSFSNIAIITSSEDTDQEVADDSDDGSNITDSSTLRSKATGQVKHIKKAKTSQKDIEKAEIEFLQSFGETLKAQSVTLKEREKEKDEETIFGDLIVSQLRQLPYNLRTVAKREITNLMFGHLLSRNSGPPVSTFGRQPIIQSSSTPLHGHVPVFQDQSNDTSIQRPEESMHSLLLSENMASPSYTPGYLFQQYHQKPPTK